MFTIFYLDEQGFNQGFEGFQQPGFPGNQGFPEGQPFGEQIGYDTWGYGN